MHLLKNNLDIMTGRLDFTTETLKQFLNFIDNNYKNCLFKISLFNLNETAKWSKEQKQLFVKLFYHARGHFYKFLWCIGCQSCNIGTKKIVLDNIKEEFGESNKSHESMYLYFAETLQVNLRKEIYEEKYYLPFLKEFDRNHIKWIVEHDSESSRVALFSAYERLDNIDYTNLLALVKNIGVNDSRALNFFRIHSHASHFERLEFTLSKVWETNPIEIKEAFHFIYSNQLNMWKLLADQINQLEN